MEMIPLGEGSEVEPGFIYVRKYKTFGRSKLSYTVNIFPSSFNVFEINPNELQLISSTFKSDRFWETDIDNLLPGEAFKLMVCSVNQIKATSLDVPKRNFEYASEVGYCFSTAFLIIMKASQRLELQKLKDCVFQCWLNHSMANISEVEKVVSKVILYCPNKPKRCYFSAEVALIDLMSTLNNNPLVPIVAGVAPIEKWRHNKSEEMCNEKQKLSRVRSTWSYLTSFGASAHEDKGKIKYTYVVEDRSCALLASYLNSKAIQEQNFTSLYKIYFLNSKYQMSLQSNACGYSSRESTYSTHPYNTRHKSNSNNSHCNVMGSDKDNHNCVPKVLPVNEVNWRVPIHPCKVSSESRDIFKSSDGLNINESKTQGKQNIKSMDSMNRTENAKQDEPTRKQGFKSNDYLNKTESVNPQGEFTQKKDINNSGGVFKATENSKLSDQPAKKQNLKYESGLCKTKNTKSQEKSTVKKDFQRNSALNKAENENFMDELTKKQDINSFDGLLDPNYENPQDELKTKLSDGHVQNVHKDNALNLKYYSNKKNLENMDVPAKGKVNNVIKDSSASSLKAKKGSYKVVLHKPLNEKLSCGKKEKIYGDEIKDDKSRKKVLFLFGEKGYGKSSLINFIGNTHMKNEVSPEKCVIDLSETKNEITFYTFRSCDENLGDLTIIDTPGLSDESLECMKTFLNSKEMTVDIHALGFVVNSQSPALTTFEKKMFDFIRSAYGEVSNNHLIAFCTFSDIQKATPIVGDFKRYGIKPQCILEFNLIQERGKNLDEIDEMFFKMNLKKWKKGWKAITQMGPISVKSMKLAQETTYNKTFQETSVKNLKEEIRNFINSDLVNSSELANKIWGLCRMTFAMQEETDYTESKLIQFIANLFAEACKRENKNPSVAFPSLILMNSDLKLTTSILTVKKFYADIFSMLCDDPHSKEIPLSVATLSDSGEVALYCSSCKNIHIGSRVLAKQDNPSFFAIECRSCQCNQKYHALWTPKDSFDMIQRLRKAADQSLKLIIDDFPHLSFQLDLREFKKLIC